MTALLDRLWRGRRIARLLTIVMGTTVALAITLVTAFDVVRQRELLRHKLEEAGLLIARTWGGAFADSLYLGDVERLRQLR